MAILKTNDVHYKYQSKYQTVHAVRGISYEFEEGKFYAIVGKSGCGKTTFLSMLAGILNINSEMYEAGYIDGISNRFQEIIYITIPSMKPQMLFGAVMAVINTFQTGAIGVQLSGANPTPQYAGQLIVNLIEDYGFIRYEMGYASAASVVLLVLIYTITRWSGKMFKED